jgi:hypothetical protein
VSYLDDLTREQAIHKIEEFYRRCAAGLGDSATPPITKASVAWIKLQSETWPYGEPNLFRQMAEEAEKHVADDCTGVFRNPEKDLLLKSFGFLD